MDSYVVLGMNINFVMVSEHKKKWCTLQECAIAWMAMTVWEFFKLLSGVLNAKNDGAQYR